MGNQFAGTQAVIAVGNNMTGAAVVYSFPTDCQGMRRWSIQNIWTGTPTGTFSYWQTNKANPDLTNDLDWVQIDTSQAVPSLATAQPAGAAGNNMIAIENVDAKIVRQKYVNSASTGALNSWSFGKAV